MLDEFAVAAVSAQLGPPCRLEDEANGVEHGVENGVAAPERRAWLTLGAACGAALALGALPARAAGTGDGEGARLALLLLEAVETLETDLFGRVIPSAAGNSLEPRERDVMSLIAQQDRQHMQWFALARAKYHIVDYGPTANTNKASSPGPRVFTFPGQSFKSKSEVFALAILVKETAVGAYQGMVARTGDLKLAQALAALAGIEGRHAASLREISNNNPVLPAAFEPALSPDEVLRNLEKYGLTSEAWL
jgi:Ferritin-like domain